MRGCGGRSELQPDGELDDGIEVEPVGDFEEIAAFAAEGGFNLGRGDLAPLVGGGVFVDEVPVGGGAEFATAHVVEPQVEGIVEGVVAPDEVGVADAEVGLEFVPAASAGDFTPGVIDQLEVEPAHVDVVIAAGFAVELGSVSHVAFAEGESGGEVELAAEGVVVKHEPGVVAVELNPGFLASPGFGAVVAEGSPAEPDAEVRIESVTDASAKP